MMPPISSLYDVRLVTLIGVATTIIEALSLQLDKDPNLILAETLYLVNKRLHESGEEVYLEKLVDHYPLLREAIK